MPTCNFAFWIAVRFGVDVLITKADRPRQSTSIISLCRELFNSKFKEHRI